ncbi:MAG: hypothetical protein EMLJLAPB_00782 [Candidatus Argoarchaeum ethanivorans]|uniref:Uncharacterized protein n=1 Tax=Candidatus Argoarchaeum ethanivorans TaxID=2608793 RepID=A0A811TG35_9EURY|nr:MAG: hypothetical protein EMLJLAPB_00782 [Candidatus Argoarchaeum ethanivorans]
MDSGQSFDDGITEWIEYVNVAVKNEVTENSEDFRLRFEKINLALTLFSPIAEKLPIDHAKWFHGDDGVIPRSSNIHIIMEFITQALYMEASHLWPAANHSLRCALEHTFWTIWQIGYPEGSKTMIGGAEQVKISDMKDKTFNIPRFKNSKKKFEFSGSAGTTKNLFEKISEVYSHLSYYVHTSNIHIEIRGARPHITHDLGANPRAERDTQETFNDTLVLIVVLLSIACMEFIENEHLTVLYNKLLPSDVYTTLEEIISK